MQFVFEYICTLCWMDNMSAPMSLVWNMPVHLRPKISVQSYSKLKRVITNLNSFVEVLVQFHLNATIIIPRGIISGLNRSEALMMIWPMSIIHMKRLRVVERFGQVFNLKGGKC